MSARDSTLQRPICLRFLIIEEVDVGEAPLVKQRTPPKLDNAVLWQAFESDSNRAGMTSDGNRAGPGVEDLLKEAEAKRG